MHAPCKIMKKRVNIMRKLKSFVMPCSTTHFLLNPSRLLLRHKHISNYEIELDCDLLCPHLLRRIVSLKAA